LYIYLRAVDEKKNNNNIDAFNAGFKATASNLYNLA
jgi:hypothetical protein